MNEIPIREVGRNKKGERSKVKILNNGSYYAHHDWGKKPEGEVNVSIHVPQYERYGCNCKLITRIFIYNILPKSKRKGFGG